MPENERESTEEKLRAMTKRLEELESRLNEESSVLNEVLTEIRLLRGITSASASVLKAASYVTRYKYGDISRHIVEALMRAGPMNVSQLTNFLRSIRGSASRRIVSKKINLLKEHDIVEEVPGKKTEKRYKLKKKE
ncbi:MAG: hypothetical protein NWF14_02380 [Candidatus Bathyarchaeota archaeon]|nr:hypothetical protein [Candidatus Bathyarchaeota archaeon]